MRYVHRLQVFLLGMWQFRHCLTPRYVSHSLNVAYNRGRNTAHFLTLFIFDQ